MAASQDRILGHLLKLRIRCFAESDVAIFQEWQGAERRDGVLGHLGRSLVPRVDVADERELEISRPEMG
jgi:hypothetical protein